MYGREAGELQLHGFLQLDYPQHRYWSSTTFRFTPGYAWGVFFDVGFVFDRAVKSSASHVRAVRGGL